MAITKKKVLISSGNAALLKDFFLNIPDDVICFSTSEYWEDVKGHVLGLEPQVYVCLIDNRNSAQLNIIKNLSESIVMHKMPVVIITDEDFYPYFAGGLYNNVAAVLKKPISISGIFGHISSIIEKKEKERLAKEEEEAAIEVAEEENRIKNILVVDDDPNILKLIKSILGEKYNVATMLSGKMATKYLESKECDLILLDYEMPVENGPAVFAKIKEIESAKDIPIVFLTGVADKEKIAEVLRLKPQGYLLKPIDTEKLFDAIQRNIG